MKNLTEADDGNEIYERKRSEMLPEIIKKYCYAEQYRLYMPWIVILDIEILPYIIIQLQFIKMQNVQLIPPFLLYCDAKIDKKLIPKFDRLLMHIILPLYSK